MVDRMRVFLPEGETARREQLRRDLDAEATSIRMQRVADNLATEVTLARRVERLGFGGEGARVFDLVPLIFVAWADGAIQKGERAAIFEILDTRGIAPDSRPARVVAALLEKRPSEAYFQEALAVCREIMGTREATAETVVELCIQVAESAGGFLGLTSKVSSEEREVLARIAESFGGEALRAFRRRFGEPS